MKYQLALELKEAGFKQSGNGGWLDVDICDESRFRYCICDGKTHFYIPTLQELIEACAKDLPRSLYMFSLRAEDKDHLYPEQQPGGKPIHAWWCSADHAGPPIM